MPKDPIEETLEIAFRDQQIRETTALMLEAGCNAEEIRAWLWLTSKGQESVN